jgi:hypothetical protein
MRTVVSTLLLACLSLALVFSGPAARAMATSDTTMVELCLDGVVKVVRLGRNGQPVTPRDDCDRTHACCIIAGDLSVSAMIPDLTAPFLEQPPSVNAIGVLIPRIEYLSADQRGPPAVQLGQIDQTEIRS